jgi:hypothetical protein
MMDLPKGDWTVIIYLARQIEWSYPRVNWSWTAKVRWIEQEEVVEIEQWSSRSRANNGHTVLAPSWCTHQDESIKHTYKSIRVDLQTFEGGQCRRRRRRRRRSSRAAGREPIMDVPQHAFTVLLYSARGIEWLYPCVNHSWTAKVRWIQQEKQQWKQQPHSSSRAASQEQIMDVTQHACTVLLYSARQIEWLYPRVNQSWTAKVRWIQQEKKQQQQQQ